MGHARGERQGSGSGLTMQDLGNDAGPCRALRLIHNIADVRFDRRLGDSQLGGDFLIGPTLQEMLHDRGFTCGQAKPFLRLDDSGVHPRTDPDLIHHDEDSFFRVGRIYEGRTA